MRFIIVIAAIAVLYFALKYLIGSPERSLKYDRITFRIEYGINVYGGMS